MTKYFEELSDSRQQGKIKYKLVEIVVIAIIAVTAGAELTYRKQVRFFMMLGIC